MNKTNDQSILLIGAGNMGSSIAKGLITNQWPAELITFCEQQASRHTSLKQAFPDCTVISGPEEIEFTPKVILLAVKPNDMSSVCQSLAKNKQWADCLYITIAAGLPVRAYQSWLGEQSTIIRCMPNTPAAIGMAMTGLYTHSSTKPEEKVLAEQILGAIGKVIWVDKESMLDAVTALSGSGPAYLFYLMQCLQKSGQALGLSVKDSYTLTLQTMLGAAQLADFQGLDFETLRANVTSKGGTTEQAINSFEQNDFASIVENAVQAAANRANEISQSFDQE